MYSCEILSLLAQIDEPKFVLGAATREKTVREWLLSFQMGKFYVKLPSLTNTLGHWG